MSFSRLLSNLKILIGIVLIISAVSCVYVPYPVPADVEYIENASFPEDVKLTLGPRDLLADVAESITETDSLLNLELFGKLGLLLWDTTVINHTSGASFDDDDTDLSYGIGVSVGSEKLFLTLEFEVLNEINGEYSPGGSTLTYGSIGAAYKF